MEDKLLHNIIELQKKLELAEKKLGIAIEGLKIISDNTDNYNVASKTLSEINSI